ncbi:pyrroline-5-carboxylate reductase [Shewanella schlegeliana]|uniref:Pyrroline-5-carboxylate reductase n=1 Tax=Shewanella schlegeliana TaxID=190308 RepID=A0ABS1T1Y4_9GAMM|nr:pyrroline-5-carboxylate reductase [Shewanella schlegeliana]MBL4914225.1 pyrroline-5-carboxylate reductase [Shewanella schlegeliana]MCL1111381.1 pyrroline-5-carboxylate reductase [Shewanella schlegeliana]GIU33948.1 pyrroline-5-carboxylate reductase [Shewanella schlegeliana]
MTQKKVCFIGAGNMTRSIVSGLVKSGYAPELIEATNPSQPKLDAMQADFGIKVSNSNLDAAQTADVIVLGVKPHLMQLVGEELSGLDLADKLIITIAAGVTAKRYGDYFKQEIKLIRTMPNTPTQIGVGLTGLYAGEEISTEQKTIAETLMATGGEVVWVDKEDDLNQVIALAGSSPAYFFLFLESMVESAVKGGMPEVAAREMAQQAALGAALMAKQNPDVSLAQLRANVTSKGGTTAQAVETFEKGNLRGLVDSAMGNCIARAEEMAKQY